MDARLNKSEWREVAGAMLRRNDLSNSGVNASGLDHVYELNNCNIFRIGRKSAAARGRRRTNW
jgi:hypothetical protein